MKLMMMAAAVLTSVVLVTPTVTEAETIAAASQPRIVASA